MRTGEWKPRFLDHLAIMGNASRAARNVGVCPDTVYEHRKSDPEFAAAWRKALKEAADVA